MDRKHVQVIEDTWRSRARVQGYKPKTALYKRSEVEFFTGAIAAINALYPNAEDPRLLSEAVPPSWVVMIMSGRPVVDMSGR